MPRFRQTILLLIFLAFFSVGRTQVRLPAIISDHMILQQQSKVALWGWAPAGEVVRIQTGWNNKVTRVKSGTDGKWLSYVPTGKAGGPYLIHFASPSGSVEVKDVFLGEVWLASGQSNMEFFIGKTPNPSYTGVINYEEVIRDAKAPLIRQIDIPNKVSDEPQSDFKGVWKLCTPSTIDTFSAVAYFFARDIHKATGFPVGIINSTWGGTPAESWTRKEVLQNDPDLNIILERYHKLLSEYPEASATFREALEKWRADTSGNKGAAPRAPVGPTSNQSPYKLYNGMIAPIVPYTLKGVIWYQGESNAGRAWQYRKLFPALIRNWRTDWKAPELPFYFVQISPHRSQNPEIRDAQLHTLRTVAHTGMAVTIDNGDSLDIHPRNKELVGKRLALWALHNQYGKKNVLVSGPLFKSLKTEGNKIRVQFDYDKGLRAEGSELAEFTIAGEDGVFYPARAKIENNSVVVWSDQVPQPKAVRYAWKNLPKPNLFNAAGLPASPFRTDSWKLKTEGLN